MCASVLWAVNRAGYTDAFRAMTESRLGVAPQPSEAVVQHGDLVRASAPAFTLTVNGCDCRAAIGSDESPRGPGEIPIDRYLDWLRAAAQTVPHLRRIAVVRAWDPQPGQRVPLRATRQAPLATLTARDLASLPDGVLLALDAAPA